MPLIGQNDLPNMGPASLYFTALKRKRLHSRVLKALFIFCLPLFVPFYFTRYLARGHKLIQVKYSKPQSLKDIKQSPAQKVKYRLSLQ
jgi:hypothetical protein